MDDKDCSMCKWYSNLEGYCSRYREIHYPSDAKDALAGNTGITKRMKA